MESINGINNMKITNRNQLVKSFLESKGLAFNEIEINDSKKYCVSVRVQTTTKEQADAWFNLLSPYDPDAIAKYKSVFGWQYAHLSPYYSSEAELIVLPGDYSTEREAGEELLSIAAFESIKPTFIKEEIKSRNHLRITDDTIEVRIGLENIKEQPPAVSTKEPKNEFEEDLER